MQCRKTTDRMFCHTGGTDNIFGAEAVGAAFCDILAFCVLSHFFYLKQQKEMHPLSDTNWYGPTVGCTC